MSDARDDRQYDLLDPVDIIDTILRAHLYDRPLELETWVDSRIVGVTLDEIARRDGVTRQMASLRARKAEHRIAQALGLHRLVAA